MKKILLYSIILSCSFALAQNSRQKSAAKLYNDYSFVKAQKKYLKLKDLNTNSQALINLANTYYFNSDYKQALTWYYKYFELHPVTPDDANSVNAYRFLQCLRSNNEHALAAIVMDAMQKEVTTPNTTPYFSGSYTVETSKTNENNDTFGLDYTNKEKKEVIFSSNRTISNFSDAKHLWNNEPYLKLYSGSIDESGDLADVKLLEGDINAFKMHQSNPTISKDGKRMYFTRSVYQTTEKGNSYLKIYTSDFKNGKWSEPYQLGAPVNIEGTSSGHPSIGPDHKLYFVSNRENPDNSDIYYVKLNKSNTVLKDKAVRLSDKINTPGREDFVYVGDNGVVYFSSDGHNGFGGLDVFAATNDGNEYHVVNLGEPLNSTADDFGFIINDKNKLGFVSSNRESAASDKLFKIKEIEPLQWKFNTNATIFGTVSDSITLEPVANTKLLFYSLDDDQLLGETTTDQNGYYTFEAPPYKEINLKISATNYTNKEVILPGIEMAQKKEENFFIFNEKLIIVEDSIVSMETGDDLTRLLKLEPIYFDYNGFSIRKSSKLELDKVIELLQDRPSVTIEIKSHTDSRGTNDYNLKLSNNRAKTTLEYIINEGKIDPSRLNAQGFGESNLFIKCKNCSEEEHQLNRRSEFIIHFNNE